MNTLTSLAQIADALAAGRTVMHHSGYWDQDDTVLAVDVATRDVTVRGNDGRVRVHSTNMFGRGDRNWAI